MRLESKTQAISLSAPAPLRGGGFCRSDGTLFEDGAHVMLDDLRGATAFGAGIDNLYLRGKTGPAVVVRFEDEQPLWALSEDIIRLLSASSGLDDTVSIEFGKGSGGRLVVGRYAIAITVTDRQACFDGAAELDDAGELRTLEWLSICEAKARTLAVRDWAQRNSRRSEALPEDLAGPGVLLLRQQGRVIGRPTLAQGAAPLAEDQLSPMGLAALQSVPAKRLIAIDAALSNLAQASPEAAADQEYLLRLIRVLNGVPPSAIDGLARLPDHPGALAILLVQAPDDELRALVWRLERDLPFMWALIGIPDWLQAFETCCAMLEDILLAGGMDRTLARDIAANSVRRTAEQVADLEPILATALPQWIKPRQLIPSTVRDAAQDRIRRVGDQVVAVRTPTSSPSDVGSTSCFRLTDTPTAALLPDFQRFDASQWEGLDAACAAALSAAGAVTLTPRQVLRIRDARAQEPFSFADMYRAALLLLARNAPLTC